MKRMFPMILLFALLLCVPVRADELTLDAPSALWKSRPARCSLPRMNTRRASPRA